MKRILVMNFFPAFVPPASGGELRYFHLYSRLSRQFDVTLLSPTYSGGEPETVIHSPTFRERRVPKEPFQDQLHVSIAEENLADEFSALVCALAAHRPNRYHEAYFELQAGVDLIIHESPYMLDYDVLAGIDGRPRIYNSYNVESDLVGQLWKGPAAARYVALVNDLEQRLVSISDACFAVSESEAGRFAEKYSLSPDLFTVIENGIVAEEFPQHEPRFGSARSALFFGSLHPPNIEAAQFIVAELAPRLPDLEFVIAGNCLPPSLPGVPANVRVLGRVDNAQRLNLFATADIALNPMRSGAGTNLKALEYLAASLPMLSTPLGARGLGLVDNHHALVAHTNDFADALERIVADAGLRRRLAAAGRKHVVDSFSWDAIAQKAASVIHVVLQADRRAARRHILLLNDFPASRPVAGGEVRINKLYSSLAMHYDITMLCFGRGAAITRTQIAPGFIEIQIAKTEAHLAAENAYNWHISAADIINYQEAPANALLVSLTRAIARHADAIVLCHPYMAGLLKGLQGPPVIYESLNVETELKRALLVGHPAYDAMSSAAAECERLAIERSSEVISVSDTDIEGLIAVGAHRDKIHLVPNGVGVPPSPPKRSALDSVRAALGGRPLCIFIGSAHPPNVDAADYIVRDLAPQMEDCVFGIIGSVCDAIQSASVPNVIAFGVLDDLTKEVVLELADVALNPMSSGSGSNLKLAEYFARCLPTVTTPFGGRGYPISNGVEAIVCSLDQFPHRLRSLIADRPVRDRMGAAAYQFAKTRLDWRIQAEKYRRVLERRIFAQGKKRLLVVTHRFTNPPLGGAEMYLLNLLKELDRRGSFVIDLATTDIVTIENQVQFGCSYERSMDLPEYAELAALDVTRFPVDELESDVRLSNATRLWTAWSEESIDLSLAHVDKLPDAVMLGGWYYAEKEPLGVQVWSSPRALVRVRSAKSLTLCGFSNHRTMLAILGDGELLSETMIDGQFELRQPLNGVEILELRIASPYVHAGDPRQLGVRIREIQVENVEGGARPLPLDLNYSDILRRVAPHEYIASLIDVARKRTAQLDALFQETRGPNSQAMEAWLKKNATTYDVILGHCLPFKTVIMAADAARVAGVPLVQLSHAHIDDRFYHWSSYFRALRSADLCIIHPRSASTMFFDPIGARSYYLPHAIADSGAPSVGDQRAFQQHYRSQLPYVLVLGRKDRSKNYSSVIRAVSNLNVSRRRCNVVMIGRDEDGDALDGNLVLYLGGQPDGVVRAALGGSLCLVTMSDSESFGIVILEAWAQRRPVIVNENCIAFTELVMDGQCGLIANTENLAQKIESLLNNPEWASEMGARGFDRVKTEFCWDAIGAGLNDVLLELSNGGAQRKSLNSGTLQ
jgi:glycosyltransferase involved in cell wall biosynthesis